METRLNFAGYSYSKIEHFENFGDADLELYGEKKDRRLCDLKVYQDLLAYTFIKRNVEKGARILEIGGGSSRIIRAMHQDYEFWNLDKLVGLGNGPTGVEEQGFRLVQDYIGNFPPEVPDNYFDLVFSISVLEHTPGDEETNGKILADMNRVMKQGALSVHSFDVVAGPEGIRANGLIPHLFNNVATVNRFVEFPDLLNDPDLFVMTEAAYDKYWKKYTMKSYPEFGKPFSYNVCWRKH